MRNRSPLGPLLQVQSADKVHEQTAFGYHAAGTESPFDFGGKSTLSASVTTPSFGANREEPAYRL